ncbi:MAG TPA: hypothetical protein P5514_07945 [Bacteroidales bacterium]|mgnify:CR=1 FL=1|nr:hypothetical protein [Bacteroidales bacterium]
MKRIYNLLIIIAVPALFLLFTSEVLYHTGSPGGKTGSPGDGGHNCTDCLQVHLLTKNSGFIHPNYYFRIMNLVKPIV